MPNSLDVYLLKIKSNNSITSFHNLIDNDGLLLPHVKMNGYIRKEFVFIYCRSISFSNRINFAFIDRNIFVFALFFPVVCIFSRKQILQ